MREYTQVALGLRSLAIKVAVFVLLAAAFAWFIGGSIFPGSQIVNCPEVEWAGSRWYAQVKGNGSHPAPVEWRIFRTDASGDDTEQRVGIEGVWRQVRGPVVADGALRYGIESESRAGSNWWLVTVDASGNATAAALPAGSSPGLAALGAR